MSIPTSAYRQIFGLLTRYPAAFISLLIASLLTSLSEGLSVGVLISLVGGHQVDTGWLGKVPILVHLSQALSDMTLVNRVRLVALALVLVVLVRGVFLYASRMISLQFQINVDRGLQEQIFKQLLDVELRFIYNKRIGDLFTILSTYTHQTGKLIQGVAGGIVELFTLVTYATLMLLVSWQITLMAVVLLLSTTILIRRQFSTRMRKAGRRVLRAIAQLNSIGFENLSAIKLIHLFSQEQRRITHFENTLQTYQERLYQRGKLAGLARPLFSTLNAIILCILLVASTFLLPNQSDAWVGRMVAFLGIVFRLMAPAAALNDTRVQVASFYPALQSVLRFLRREDKPYLKNGHIRFEEIKEKVALEGVTFSYDSSETAVLTDVAFEIPKGKVTAVVGPSGAGKTTLVDLVARLYDCDAGRITVDGVDLRDLDIGSWHSQIAVVSQDTFIFNDTVISNIKFAKEDATGEAVHQAARLANAHDFIMALPQGYETVLGDRGVRLSGGQRQRIAIARATLPDPQLLILDEATSNLDTETERSIQEAINRLSQGRTVLVVAHRLSTVRHADNIVVLDDGKVVEQGTHEELIRGRGHYWRLVQAQSLEGNA